MANFLKVSPTDSIESINIKEDPNIEDDDDDAADNEEKSPSPIRVELPREPRSTFKEVCALKVGELSTNKVSSRSFGECGKL